MNFLQTMFDNLDKHAGKPLISEVHGETIASCTGGELAKRIGLARAALREAGVKAGDRVVLVSPNSIGWVAADLATLAEGAVVVPMYARQDPAELVEMMHDSDPSCVLCATDALAASIREHWADAPLLGFDQLFRDTEPVGEPPASRADDEPITLIYTSGTSGTPKGAMLTTPNVDYMLPVTANALLEMMGPRDSDDRVFHYLPFCFAGSRIVLWTCLWRGNGIMVSTDLDNLAVEMRTARPHYLLNVPMLLERIKGKVEEKIRQRAAPVQYLYDRGKLAYDRVSRGVEGRRDRLALALANRVVFSKIASQIGENLECLICGSAPLAEDTQRWFEMLGIPVYQVYGLTETTAIVTMDRPPVVVPGRVGPAIDGIEVELGDDGELLVRGPNVFAGYWRREAETAAALADGWFRTGDRAERDETGNFRIVGRVKNVLVPTSGHNVAPEPIEQQIIGIEGVEQAVVVGHGRPYLGAIVVTTNGVDVQAGLDRINADLPHYRRIRKFYVANEPFTIENGLLTANRKLRRGAIEQHFANDVDALYA